METIEKKPIRHLGLNLVYLLGGKTIVTRPIRSEFDIIALSNEGITKASLDALTGHLGVSKKVFAESILGISVKTLERKKSTDRLDKYISSHVLEIAKVAKHAFDVFEDEEKVKNWLNTPNRALNNIKPLDLFYIPTGLGIVNTILGRIKYGIFS